jgi:transposase
MYVKKVRKRNGKTNKIYEYIHLVENIRTEKGPRQRLVLNLGNLDIYSTQYKAFAKRVEDILTGQRSFIELDTGLEKQAHAAAEKIFRKQAREIGEEAETDYQSVDVNSLESQTHRSIGPEYVCHAIWEELGLNDFFARRGVTRHVLPLMEALVVGRLVDPGSERYTKGWVERRSALYELAGSPLRPSLNSYYRAGDRLYGLKEELEKHLSGVERDLFSLTERMYFFDLTNSYFEGKGAKNPKAAWGRSKEKRNDCKLVALGLIIDECGFSKYSELFAGNQFEGETLEGMIRELECQLPDTVRDKTVVVDAGIATEENIGWLKEKGYHYVVVNRGNPPFEGEYEGMEVIREDEGKGIRLEVKRYEHEGEVYVLCRSEQKVVKERSMRTRVEQLFVERLEYHRKGLRLPNRTKKYGKVVELVGRLREKYPRASKLYRVEVIPEGGKAADDPSLVAVDIVWKEKAGLYEEETGREGSYVLRTDRVDLSDKEIWETYNMLRQIEYAFKSMKSSLGLRPNFHQVEGRVDTHMFISVLAYHLLHIIEYRLRQKGDHRSWRTIRTVLKTHERLTIGYKQREGGDGAVRQQYVRINSTVEPEHMEIYRKLGLLGKPLPRKRIAVNQ